MPSQTFPAWPQYVPIARGFVAEALGHLPEPVCRTAELLVSELATNAVRHAGGRFEVVVEHTPNDGRLWVGVTDTGPGYPILQAPGITAEHGRGLQLVNALADRWGVRRRRGTDEKTVWFELAAGSGDAGAS